MRRREFITVLGGAAAASTGLLPLAARAQQPARVGFLSVGEPPAILVEAFRRGVNEAGYGQNVAIEYSSGHYSRFPALAADLVRRQVAVIVALGGTPAAIAARAATSTIPIVFYIGGDPIMQGLVDSFSRPGGNVTGVTNIGTELGSKRLELLQTLVPNATLIGMLVNPSSPDASTEIRDIERAATALDRQVHIVSANDESEFGDAFAELVERKVGALIVGSDALFTFQRIRLVEFSKRYGLPTIYDRRDFVLAGGLISYGHNRVHAYRQLGLYAGRILNGAKPADLPVVQPTQFELVINLKTAKAHGLTIPPSVLAIADEVVE
jgi:putative ABC transport system substrate-binding protein